MSNVRKFPFLEFFPKSHAAAVKIAPFAEYNHLFSKGTDRLRLCQGRLDSTLLDEAANLVCQQQIFDARLSGPI